MRGWVRQRVARPDAAGAWRLDLAELLAAVTPATRMLLVNAPNNPTGWTLTRAEQLQILAHCRATGTWLVADEVYERVYFGGGASARLKDGAYNQREDPRFPPSAAPWPALSFPSACICRCTAGG